MAFAIAGLFARGETIIRNTDCVNTSYPGFARQLAAVVAESKEAAAYDLPTVPVSA
jgi:3-phosphoshikimate 1-carboxyvinyltransferase